MGPAPDAPAELRADTNRVDVYLNDSLEAAEAINRTNRLAGAGRWREAVELLQQTADSSGDKLVQLSSGYYVNVRERIARLIAGWPADGLNVYRALAEPQIRVRLDARLDSRDVNELLPIFERYFCTHTAAQLADTIGQLALESGNLALARRAYRRVVDSHPDRATFAKRYQAMLAIVSAMDGQTSEKLVEPEAGLRIRWMGQDRPIGEVMAEVAAGYTALREPPSPMEWPMFAGSPERNRRASCRIDEPGLLWRLRRSELSSNAPEAGEADENTDRDRSSSSGAMHPVVSEGLIFVASSRQVIALHQNTGSIAWWFRADENVAVGSKPEPTQPGGESVTVSDGRVYAALPGDPGPYYGTDGSRRGAAIVCLQADSGRLLWRSEEAFRPDRTTDVTFDFAPLIQQDRGFVVGRRRRFFGFEDCYLYGFDANSGAILFSTHLGSASTGTSGFASATTSVASLHGDAVYVCTNLGSIAAVSASSGSVDWLRVYDRGPLDETQGNWTARERQAWEINPMMWTGGRLVCAPSDSANVLVLSSRDGSLLQSVPLLELGRARTLLGVSGDLLCTAGREVLCYDLAANEVRWTTSLSESESPAGRGLWADDALFVPLPGVLGIFRTQDGQRRDVSWGPEGEAGNLLATPDQLVVAGATGIASYVRKAELWSRLRDRMQGTHDPIPALELAEVALRAGDAREAMSALEEAARRQESLEATGNVPTRQRLFDVVLAFLAALSTRGQLEKDQLEVLYRYAQEFAPDPRAHVAYRLRFAPLLEERGQPERAVALYQQILRDQSLRALETSQPRQPAQQAGAIAETRIAQCLERFGRSIYAPFEAEARQWLLSGREIGDRSILARVLEVFPNSQSAPLALIAQGDVLVREGRHEEAARLLTKAYHQYPAVENRPLLLKHIADAYENSGQPIQAYRWVVRAAREYPTALIEHEGRSLTFPVYRERLSHIRSRLEPSPPKLKLPLNPVEALELEEGATLLIPRFADDPASRWSRVFVSGPAGIIGMDAKTGRRLWPNPSPVRLRPELLLAGDDISVFANQYEIVALENASGRRRWSHGEYPERLADPNADWEDGEAIRAHALHDGRLVSVRDGGLITSLNVADGHVVWSQVHRPVAAGPISLQDRLLAYTLVQDHRVVICLLDAAAGRWQGAITTNEERAVEDLILTLDGLAVLVTARSVIAYDPQTREIRWRVPVDGRIRRESANADWDALYFTDDGLHLQKINLDNGGIAWRSDRVFPNREDEFFLQRLGETLIASTASSLCAVDTVTGVALWRGAAPKEARWVRRLLTDSDVVAIHIPAQPDKPDAEAWFFDHRRAAGILPKNANVLPLAPLPDLRTIVAADNGLWIQTGATLRLWSSP